jgi:hypothetical protein
MINITPKFKKLKFTIRFQVGASLSLLEEILNAKAVME